MKLENNWLSKPLVELIFICLTPFICLLFIFLFPNLFQSSSKTDKVWWIVLILLIDVGHVYSTIFRTYLDKAQWFVHKREMIAIPIISFLVAVLLYQISYDLFWRIIAYIAVFHFIRQQYGFMRVYDRTNLSSLDKKINSVTIYASTIYPLIYWHCYGPFEFNWFTANDFLFYKNILFHKISFVCYLLIMSIYFIRTVYNFIVHKKINIPVFLIVLGTALSWYFGIVYFKGDLTFTLLNVISHGIPYVALVWLFGEKVAAKKHEVQYGYFKYFFKKYSLPLFLLIPIIFGYIEEGFWDSIVWNEHKSIFSFFYQVTPSFILNAKAIIIPLLIMAQLTHYFLDGFIWKLSKGHLAK
jgi:hypothetical protein